MGKEKVFEDMGLERESICVRCVFLTTDENYERWICTHKHKLKKEGEECNDFHETRSGR